MKSKIHLHHMRFYAYHGVLPQEQKVGNWFWVDLSLEVDLSGAALSDDLQDTLNYAEVYDLVAEEMTIPSRLLEHVAGRIIRRLQQQFPLIQGIRIELGKEYPPFKQQADGVSIIMEC